VFARVDAGLGPRDAVDVEGQLVMLRGHAVHDLAAELAGAEQSPAGEQVKEAQSERKPGNARLKHDRWFGPTSVGPRRARRVVEQHIPRSLGGTEQHELPGTTHQPVGSPRSRMIARRDPKSTIPSFTSRIKRDIGPVGQPRRLTDQNRSVLSATVVAYASSTAVLTMRCD
jgi:hypothetical protein